MAWTAPRTWVTAELVTAAIMNTHVRDNLLETGPAKVTTAGDVLVATGANALKRLAMGAALKILRVNAGGTDLEYATLDASAAGAIADSANTVDDTHIDWGTGANQVSAVDLPIADSGGYYTGAEVETALAEVGASIDTLEEVDAGARIYGYKNLGGAL